MIFLQAIVFPLYCCLQAKSENSERGNKNRHYISRSEFIQETPPERLEKLAKKQKHLIFKAGPPASGKSHALSIVLKELGIAGEPYLAINIDKFVEKNQEYKDHTEFARRALRSIVHTASSQPCGLSTDVSSVASIIPPQVGQLVCQSDFLAYFKHRPKADMEAQALLFTEFLETPHYRNIVYESTGSKSSYQFILKLGRMARLHGYKVHIVYPMVRWAELIRRSELRALKLGRLVCPERIRQIRYESRLNLRDIIRKLDIPDFPVDSVMLINNEGKEGQMKKTCHFHKMPERLRRQPAHEDL